LKRNAMSRLLAAAALIVMSFMPAPASAGEAPQTASLITEVRRTFTIDGKPIPPEIFRDFGDGDLADTGPIWVTVDVKASIGSNLGQGLRAHQSYQYRLHRAWRPLGRRDCHRKEHRQSHHNTERAS
jgi:hypothetical protein